MGTRLQTCNLQSTGKETCQRSLGTTQSNLARNWWQQWWIICWNYRRSQYTSFANRKIIYKQVNLVNLVNLQALLGVAATNLIYVGLTSSDTGWATSCRFAPQMLVFLHFPGCRFAPLRPPETREMLWDALRGWEGSCLASAGASTASNIFWSSSFRIALQEGSYRNLSLLSLLRCTNCTMRKCSQKQSQKHVISCYDCYEQGCDCFERKLSWDDMLLIGLWWNLKMSSILGGLYEKPGCSASMFLTVDLPSQISCFC